jgi:hypothetical protein
MEQFHTIFLNAGHGSPYHGLIRTHSCEHRHFVDHSRWRSQIAGGNSMLFITNSQKADMILCIHNFKLFSCSFVAILFTKVPHLIFFARQSVSKSSLLKISPSKTTASPRSDQMSTPCPKNNDNRRKPPTNAQTTTYPVASNQPAKLVVNAPSAMVPTQPKSPST